MARTHLATARSSQLGCARSTLQAVHRSQSSLQFCSTRREEAPVPRSSPRLDDTPSQPVTRLLGSALTIAIIHSITR